MWRGGEQYREAKQSGLELQEIRKIKLLSTPPSQKKNCNCHLNRQTILNLTKSIQLTFKIFYL